MSFLPNKFIFQKIYGEIFHVTSLENFEKILSAGAILANSGSSFNFSQSKISYGFKNGYISIFDFKNCPLKDIKTMANVWVKILYTHERTVLILLNPESLTDQIIPNKIILEPANKTPSLMQNNYFIPHVEAWIPSAIPVNCFSAVFLIDQENKKLHKIL